MDVFEVNEYITLKLENGETNIYLKGVARPFMKCKYVLTRKTIFELNDFLESIESVDELAEHLDHSLEKIDPKLIDIPPETRFWVHCSNMQVWAENNYDTRLLHSNLSFPLLRELSESEIRDPIAKKVFREEIAKRIHSGYLPVIKSLIDQKYIDYLEREELETIYLDANPKLRKALTKSLEDRSSLRKYSRPILKKLIELGDPSVIKFIKKNFTESVKSRDFSQSLRIIHNLDVKGPRVFYLENNPALNDYFLKMIHNKETFIKNIGESYKSKSRYYLRKLKNIDRSKIKSVEEIKRMANVIAYNSSFINEKNIDIPPVNEKIMEISLIFEIILTLAGRGDTSAIQIYESLRQAILLDPSRKELYEFIENNPGMKYINMLKILTDRYGKSDLEAERIIYLLERFKFIKNIPYNYGSAKIPYGVSDRIGELYFFLRDDLNRKIIKLLLDIPRIEFLELKKELGEPERKIHIKIRILERVNLLVRIDKTRKKERKANYFIKIKPEVSENCARIIKDLEALEILESP